MKCREYLKYSRHQALGRRDPERAREFQHHLESCPECQEARRWDRFLDRQLAAAAAPRPPEGFNQGVWARIAAHRTAVPSRPRLLPAALGLLGAAAAAAALLLIFARPFEIGPPVPGRHKPAAGDQAGVATVPGISPSQSQPSHPAPVLQPGLIAELPVLSPPLPGIPRQSVPPEVGKAVEAVQLSPPSQNPPGGQTRMPAKMALETVAGNSGQNLSSAGQGPSAGMAASAPVTFSRVLNNKIRIGRGERARLEFQLGRAARVSVKIYSRTGKSILTLADETFTPGLHTVEWNGATATGEKVASGIYFMVLNGEIPEKRFKIAVIK